MSELSKDKGMKMAVGAKNRIPSAIDNNLVDENDLVITDDTHEMVFVDSKKKTHSLVSRNKCFSDKATAIEALNASTETYAGQIVMIADENGEYNIFTVQKDTNYGWKVKEAIPESAPSPSPEPSPSSNKIYWKRI